jgi:hypothetical protein
MEPVCRQKQPLAPEPHAIELLQAAGDWAGRTDYLAGAGVAGASGAALRKLIAIVEIEERAWTY